MSDKEKKSGGTAIGSSVIMVEKTTSSCHKQPYRPTELEDDADLHHKRSKAPVVPSVAEEFKNVTEDSGLNENAEIEEQKEYPHAISSEKHKHSVAKKLSSSTKKREPSPESIALTTIETDKKKPPPQPIPADVQTDLVAAEKEAAKKADSDSITDEITELRTPEVEKEHSNWIPHTPVTKKKGISWNDREYQQNIVLQEIGARSEAWMLDRKASVGPCFRPGMPFEGPSGIMICLPKKSTKCVYQPSGISINISRNCCLSKSKSTVNDLKKPKCNTLNSEKEKSEKVTCEPPVTNCVSNIREKLSNFHSKIRSVFHM